MMTGIRGSVVAVLLSSLFLLCSTTAATSAVEVEPFSAHYEEGRWSVQAGKGGVAWATLERTGNQTGWHVLTVVSQPDQDDAKQAFATGFLEGALSYDLIWDAWRNYAQGTSIPNLPQGVEQFLASNMEWVRSMAAQQQTVNEYYWKQVALVLQQVDGLLLGYNQYAPSDQQLSSLAILLLQAQEEVGDIATAVKQRDSRSHTVEDDPLPLLDSHCSSLVKLSKDGQRLFASHDTWSGFSDMLRVYKFYKNGFHLPSNVANSIAYSSSPGALPSGDDFYVTSQNMVIMETTNGVMNQTLFANVTIHTVPYWIRVQVANQMAASGKQWVFYFSLYNSGTYNNQWIVVDYKEFTPGSPLRPGTLWIAEQIPGYVISSDETQHLQQSYWASYNIPYFPFVYNISGYPQYFEKYGDTYSYSHCARANIFRRDAPQVETMEDMQHIMRYNKYQHDPLSLQDSCRGISARCDLNPPWATNTLNKYSAFGGIDSKITDHTMAAKLESIAVSGPTWASQPVFVWNEQWSDVPHHGHPTVMDFDFVHMDPKF